MDDLLADPALLSVSVVIPVRDHAATLGEAIESALGQTQPPAEVLVIDDGSSDGSGAVADAFGHPVRVLRQEGMGIAAARNAGILQASGEAIAFLDSDDRWLPDKLERQVRACGQGIDVVSGRVANVPDAAWQQVVRDGAERETWMEGPAPSGVLIRRSAFERVGLFRDFPAGEFIDWFDRARAAGLGILGLEDLVVLRRIHAENHGVRHRELYAEGYLAVVRAALARRGEPSR